MYAYNATNHLFYTKFQHGIESIKKWTSRLMYFYYLQHAYNIKLLEMNIKGHTSKDNGASNIFKHLGQIFEEAEFQDIIG